MKVRPSLIRGFTLVEIMIVVATIGMLAAIAIPNYVRARTSAQQKACIENLRQLDSAKQQWALETRQPIYAVPFGRDIRAYLGRGTRASQPKCPATSDTNFYASYSLNSVGELPTCNIVWNHRLP